jgi:trehalose 6-phosphate synthase/phosphatase
MGIDANAFAKRAEAASDGPQAARLRVGRDDLDLIVSVDRLDYTKGIPRRLMAFERFLERYPERRGHVRLVQVASPSRESVEPYRDLRRNVNELVGRINGRFATDGIDPIHYIARTLSPRASPSSTGRRRLPSSRRSVTG